MMNSTVLILSGVDHFCGKHIPRTIYDPLCYLWLWSFYSISASGCSMLLTLYLYHMWWTPKTSWKADTQKYDPVWYLWIIFGSFFLFCFLFYSANQPGCSRSYYTTLIISQMMNSTDLIPSREYRFIVSACQNYYPMIHICQFAFRCVFIILCIWLSLCLCVFHTLLSQYLLCQLIPGRQYQASKLLLVHCLPWRPALNTRNSPVMPCPVLQFDFAHR